MKAINLIPLEERRGTTAGGRSGGAVYGVLGALLVLVVMASAYAMSTRDIKAAQSDLARVQAEAATTQAQADKLAAYTQFADMRKRRVATVASLAASRFDWPHALHEISRTIPSNAWLTSLRGTVSPTTTAAGAADPLRAALPLPAVEIAGCTTTQANVARMVASMRLIDGVEHVSLSSSEKSGTGGGSATSGDSCSVGNRPKFSMTVFFHAQAAPAPAAGATAAAATGQQAPPAGAATTGQQAPPAGATTTPPAQSQPTPASNGSTP
jgi:Tfp pilus assembly protein PilN